MATDFAALEAVIKQEYGPAIRYYLEHGVSMPMPPPRERTPAEKMKRRLEMFQYALKPNEWTHHCDCW